MAQQLIVEGSDGIVIANICKKRRLPPPKGYANEQKFVEEFMVASGGYAQALTAFRDALDNSNLNRIGIVVDADESVSTVPSGNKKHCCILGWLGKKNQANG